MITLCRNSLMWEDRLLKHFSPGVFNVSNLFQCSMTMHFTSGAKLVQVSFDVNKIFKNLISVLQEWSICSLMETAWLWYLGPPLTIRWTDFFCSWRTLSQAYECPPEEHHSWCERRVLLLGQLLTFSMITFIPIWDADLFLLLCEVLFYEKYEWKWV